MSKWIPSWSYVPIDYGLDVAVLENVSQRLLIRNNLAGEGLRVRFQNRGGEVPLVIDHAAVQLIDRVTGRLSALRPLRLNGESRIVLPPDSRPWSDPAALTVTADDDLLLWCYFRERSAARSVCVTFTAGSWQCTQLRGDYASTDALGYTFKSELAPLLASDPNHNEYAAGVCSVAVLTGDESRSIAVFGDSITQMSYFSDALYERLCASYPGSVSLVNGGICGNRIRKSWPVLPDFPGGGKQFGPAGRDRFAADLYDDAAPDAVFILEGVNDCTHSLVFGEPDVPTAADIFAALSDVAGQAYARGSRVCFGTVPPFGGFGEPWREGAEALRCELNALIRGQAQSRTVVDLDALLRDPDDPHRMRADSHLGDGVHPNRRGGELMAAAVFDTCFSAF